MKQKSEPKLLTRDEFRKAVFDRDGWGCVFCGREDNLDAHHIIERRLWPDGGYYLDNGATVCQQHHLECERTLVSVEEVRERCKITKKVLPPHLYADTVYDKWGNPVLPNGQRLKGELFYDESVQKVLGEGSFLTDFVHYVKYPRTNHCPWSPGMNSDDRMMPDMLYFHGKRVVVTEKMDGENSTVYKDYIHARSVESKSHPTRDWLRQFASQWQHELPDGWRVCGENLYAKHSIGYQELPSYFMGFSIWNERNVCLGWPETLEWFELLGITPVPVLWEGVYNEAAICAKCNMRGSQCDTTEGYVVRLEDMIPYGDFRKAFAKYVRKDHVMTTTHWFYGQQITKNELKR